MTITKLEEGDTLVVALEGRLDTTTAPDLQSVLIPEMNRGKRVRLDFKALAYVSSAGLRVLLLGEKAAKAKGGSMTLANVSEEILELFEMTGFSDIFTVEESASTP